MSSFTWAPGAIDPVGVSIKHKKKLIKTISSPKYTNSRVTPLNLSIKLSLSKLNTTEEEFINRPSFLRIEWYGNRFSA